MSTYVDIVDTIMDRFATEWGTSTKIIFEESNREEVKVGSNENWVRLAIIPFNSMSASSGIGDGGLNRHKGMISIQVYVPESGIWNRESGFWNADSELWNLQSEIWNPESGIRDLESGI